MTFDDLVTGQSVFLDANTFVYQFAPDPVFGPACSQLLLTGFQLAIDKVLNSAVQTVTVPPALISIGAAVSRQTGLLTNDALIVAVMQASGLTHLASNDADFDRVPGLTRYAPA